MYMYHVHYINAYMHTEGIIISLKVNSTVSKSLPHKVSICATHRGGGESKKCFCGPFLGGGGGLNIIVEPLYWTSCFSPYFHFHRVH